MRLALRELRRRPARFAIAGGALSLLVLLLLFLGGLLDGLFFGATGAIRINEADAVVFSDDARDAVLRSSIDLATAATVAEVDGVAAVGGLGLALLGVQVPGHDGIVDAAVAGYELPSAGLPPPPTSGGAYADRRLRGFGADVGDVVLVGPRAVPLEIVGWVEDSNYLLQNGLWVDAATWRSVLNANRPDAVVADGVFQVLVVRLADGVDVDDAIARIDVATGSTASLSEHDAVFSVPGIVEQNRTFTAVIWVTVFVAGLVVALFFALLTLERVGLYAVLKAIGATDGALVAVVVTQAVVVAFGAFVVGGSATALLAQVVPAGVPVQFRLGRAAFVLVAVCVTAALGSLLSLRRITRIDPASALG